MPYRPSQKTASAAARAAYKTGKLRPKTIIGKNTWHYKPGESGPRRATYASNGNRMIAYRGTHTPIDAWKTWGAISRGDVGTTSIAKNDRRHYDRLRKKLPSDKLITVTGHSMGADRARSLTDHRKQVHGYGFNSGTDLRDRGLSAFSWASNWVKGKYTLPGQMKSRKTKRFEPKNPAGWSPMTGLLNPLLSHNDF